jgi:hypothetical protein
VVVVALNYRLNVRAAWLDLAWLDLTQPSHPLPRGHHEVVVRSVRSQVLGFAPVMRNDGSVVANNGFKVQMSPHRTSSAVP